MFFPIQLYFGKYFYLYRYYRHFSGHQNFHIILPSVFCSNLVNKYSQAPDTAKHPPAATARELSEHLSSQSGQCFPELLLLGAFSSEFMNPWADSWVIQASGLMGFGLGWVLAIIAHFLLDMSVFLHRLYRNKRLSNII